MIFLVRGATIASDNAIMARIHVLALKLLKVVVRFVFNFSITFEVDAKTSRKSLIKMYSIKQH